MTRSRSLGNVPGEIVAAYYGQRAEAGLIVTEGTAPAADGLGYARIPGLFSAEQVAGWKRVTAAVHQGGGRIFVQLMHTGRVSHPANLPAGARVIAPSALAAPGTMYTDAEGMQPFPVPEVMTEADVEAALDAYAHSAELAVEAGFDGVELHGANGYLIDQFLNTASNQRTDAWGGSVEGRARFALEAAARVANKIGADRLGIRISPYGAFNGMAPDEAHDALYEHLATKLSDLGLLYVHVVDHSAMGAPPVKAEDQARHPVALPRRLHPLGRLRPGARRARPERGPRRFGGLRAPVPRQPPPRLQAQERRAPPAAGHGHGVHARREGVHRLPARRVAPKDQPSPRRAAHRATARAAGSSCSAASSSARRSSSPPSPRRSRFAATSAALRASPPLPGAPQRRALGDLLPAALRGGRRGRRDRSRPSAAAGGTARSPPPAAARCG